MGRERSLGRTEGHVLTSDFGVWISVTAAPPSGQTEHRLTTDGREKFAVTDVTYFKIIEGVLCKIDFEN